MNVTLDGFMSGPAGELDWHFNSWSEEMAACAAEQLGKADTIVLGRITYCAMAMYWPLQTINVSCAREDVVFADMMNSYTKIVFSKTLPRATWHNTKLVKGNITKEIIQLKQSGPSTGKDIMVYGSGSIVTALTKAGLVDEFRIWVHPVVLGRGKALFDNLQQQLSLQLVKTTTFLSGVVILHYVPKN